MGIFLPSVEGSTEGTPRGCRRPRGVSPRWIPTREVDPDTRGGITHTPDHGRKYWHYFWKRGAAGTILG